MTDETNQSAAYDAKRYDRQNAGTTLDPRRWKALALLCAAFFMVCLDGQIVMLALPSIERDLGFTSGGVQWVLSAYMLTLGGLLLLGGRVSDLLGRRRLFLFGSFVFLVSSILCGAAWSPEVLVTARVVQGISAAIMTPSALSILMTTFPEGSERNRALGLWSGMGATGATAALLLGGPINDWLGWPWIFYINVPVCILILGLAPFLLNESRDQSQGRSFDVAGAVTVTGALAAFIFAVSEVPVLGWSSGQTLGFLALAAVLLIAFVGIERRAKAPLVPLRIFRSRSLVGGNLIILLAGMLVFGMATLVSLYSQKVLGYSALAVGLGTAVYTVTSVLASYASGPLAAKVGVKTLASLAMVFMGAGCLLLSAISVQGDFLRDLVPGLLVFGPGIGIAFVAGSIAALTGVPPEDAGLASGINSATFQIGGALGVATVATISAVQASANPNLALVTAGYSTGFLACVVLALCGLAVALVVLEGSRKLESSPVAGE